ncbi:MAG: PPOX class F420-dependent oxidoreductase [Streptosporangiales bacterium]|nr:PPOX class F420-dependent oxidoreductase [Streptosporangiales bacterium]
MRPANGAPLHVVAGVVEAPAEKVTELALAVRPGPVGPDNAFLLDGGSDVVLAGGPRRFAGPHIHVEVDREHRVFATEGNWWYRGEYTFEPHERGTIVVHRVYNIARVGRWAVPLVLLQYRLSGMFTAHTLMTQVEGVLRRIGDRLGCPAYLLAGGDPSASEALQPLRTSRVALLTSYRRDGRGVGTPVGITVRKDRAYFTTRSQTWKVKRIANNPRIALAPCTKRGRVLGPTVYGIARRLDDAEVDPYGGRLQYRLWTLVYRAFYRDVPVSYEMTPIGDG